MYMGSFATFLRCAFLAILLAGCATPADPFEAVAVGDTRARVVELLGKPLVPEQDMTHNEREAVQGAVDAMNEKGARSISIWKQGSERFEIVGFDSKGMVTFKRRFFYQAP